MTTTLIKSDTDKCLYCGHIFSIRWLSITGELTVFLAGKRKYFDARQGIIEHKISCMGEYYEIHKKEINENNPTR